MLKPSRALPSRSSSSWYRSAETSRADTSSRVSTRLPAAARWRTIAISGTSPDPPATNNNGPPSAARHVKCSAHRPADLELISYNKITRQIRRDLAILDPLDRQRDPRLLRRRRDRVERSAT